MQAEEQARHFERELAKVKKILELEKEKTLEVEKENAALMAQLAGAEREKARLHAEVRTIKGVQSDREVEQLHREVTALRREKGALEQTVQDIRLGLELRRDLPPPSPPVRTPSMLSPDSIPSRDGMAGLKQRLARVKDQLETKFIGSNL